MAYPPRRDTITLLSIAALAVALYFWLTSHYSYYTSSHRGRVLVLVVRTASDTDDWLRGRRLTVDLWRNLRPKETLEFAGIQVAPLTTIDRYEYTYYSGATKGLGAVKLQYGLFAVPYWLIATAAAAPAAGRTAVAVRRRRRVRRGHCAQCGYDLRESPDKCPECGTAVPR
jgi:hypothetical protein